MQEKNLLVLFLLIWATKCLMPGTAFRGDGDGFYELPTSYVSSIFMPSVDAYLVAETSSDYNDYPGLRRLILMDAAGNYLSEYSPPTTTFVKTISLSSTLLSFNDPTESMAIIPLLEGFQIYKVKNDSVTGVRKIYVERLVKYGDLKFRLLYKILSVQFTNQLFVLHDLEGDQNEDLGMISKVELAQVEVRVMASTVLNGSIYDEVSETSFSWRNDDQLFVFGEEAQDISAQVLNATDLSVTVSSLVVRQIQDNYHAIIDIVQDSRRKELVYFVTDGGLYVVDLTDPTSPLLVNYFSVEERIVSLQEIPGASAVALLLKSNSNPEVSQLATLADVRDDMSLLGSIKIVSSTPALPMVQPPAPPVMRRRLAAVLEMQSGVHTKRKIVSRILSISNFTGPYLILLTLTKDQLQLPVSPGQDGQEVVEIFKNNSNLYLVNPERQNHGMACCSLKQNQTHFAVSKSSSQEISKTIMRVFSMVPMSECLALYCHECSEGPNICSLCFEGFALYQGSCVTLNNLPAGLGIDVAMNTPVSPSYLSVSDNLRIWNSNAIKVCHVKQCTNCKFNYKECKSCKAGRTLSNGVCNMELDTRLQALPSQSTETQLGYILELTSESSELPNLTASEYADLATNYLSQGWLTTGFSNSKNSTVISSTQQPRVRVKAVSATVYTVTVSYNRIPENTDTLVLSTNNTSGTLFNYSEGSLSLRRKNTSFVLDLQLVSSSDKIERFASLGGTVSALTLSTDNYAGSSILMVLMAFDFSGYLLRFAQIIKIVNKIRFFNLNYGPKLMAYLDALGDMFKILGPRDQSKDVYNSRAFRGRISRKYVDLEFSKVFSDKIPVYLISWFILLVNWVISLKNIVVPKFYLHVMKFHPKIHLIVFNILHIDFIFYGSRTLLHARDMHTDTNLAFLILVLVSADFFLLLNAIYSESAWLRTLTWARIEEDPVAAAKRRKELALRSDVEVVLPVEMEEQDKLDSTHLDNIEDSEINNNKTEKPEPNKDDDDEEKKPVGPQINYPLTYSRIDWMRQRAVLLATPLLLDDRVFANKGCRAHLIIHLMRVSAYQFLPICGQYASGLLITMLAMVEVVKIYHLWTTAGAFPYLKTKIAFVSELIQSMFLLLFLFLLFLMHFKDFGESVLDGPQLFCITLITIAVITEWLLTIVMLIIGLVFGKKKPAKGEKKQTTGIKISEIFIYYSKAEATDEPEQKQVISVVPKSKPVVSESTNQSSDVKQMIATRPADTLDGKIAELRIQPKVYSHDSESWSKDSQVLSTRRPVNKIIASNMGQSNLSKSHSNWNPNPQKEVSERILEYYKRRKLAT